jgi:hypothetical protein
MERDMRRKKKERVNSLVALDGEEKRLNIVLPMRTVSRIENLKEKTLAASTTEVIRTAILTYEALVEQLADGNRFYVSKSGENKFHPVNFVFDVLPNLAGADA